MKIEKIQKGEYKIENAPYANTTVYIYKVYNGCWIWNIDKGMTKGEFKTLTEAKKYFGIGIDK